MCWRISPIQFVADDEQARAAVLARHADTRRCGGGQPHLSATILAIVGAAISLAPKNHMFAHGDFPRLVQGPTCLGKKVSELSK